MVNLSLWQFDRLDERRDFNQNVRERATLQTTDVRDLDFDDPRDLVWRRAGAIGSYLADEQVLVLNRSQDGVAGYNVVTPMLLEDGRAIAIVRGFVPLDRTPPQPPPGDVRVVGILRTGDSTRRGQAGDPDGDLDEFLRFDLDRLADQIEPELLPIALAVDASDPADDAVLRPVAPPDLSEGPHLSYAIQWIIFSIAVVAGWALAVKRSIRRSRSQPSA